MKGSVENSIRGMLAKHGEDKEIMHAMFLYPMLRWRLHGNFENGVEQGGMNDYVQLFTINLTSQLAGLFATLAVIITGLGLFGLAAFTAEQRTKEIGIRKVLGASVSSLVNLITKEFSILVLVSLVISAPFAWWMLNQYLERYPIRTAIAWWVFPVTAAIALVFALTVVSTQAFRAAHSDPVKSLRSE